MQYRLFRVRCCADFPCSCDRTDGIAWSKWLERELWSIELESVRWKNSCLDHIRSHVVPVDAIRAHEGRQRSWKLFGCICVGRPCCVPESQTRSSYFFLLSMPKKDSLNQTISLVPANTCIHNAPRVLMPTPMDRFDSHLRKTSHSKSRSLINQNNTNPNSNGSVLSAYCSSVLGPQLPVPNP